MQIISVNLGEERKMQNGKPSETTGIYKMPVQHAVRAGRLGLAEDVICDTQNHGGVDQAVYIYGAADYAWWSGELGKALEPGTFGDNLTISELESAKIAIGDRFFCGEVILEATAARIPCATLALRMEDPQFVKRFRTAERPGVYCRVLQEGLVEAGMAVRYAPYAGERITLLEMFRDYYAPNTNADALRRYLSVPLAARARADKEAQLRKIANG